MHSKYGVIVWSSKGVEILVVLGCEHCLLSVAQSSTGSTHLMVNLGGKEEMLSLSAAHPSLLLQSSTSLARICVYMGGLNECVCSCVCVWVGECVYVGLHFARRVST